MIRNGAEPAGDTFRVGAEWDITDIIFEPLEVSWKDWESDFPDDMIAEEPPEAWVIKEPSYSDEYPPEAEWSIDDTPIFDYPDEEREAMVFINNPEIETSQSNFYSSADNRISRVWLNLRRVFQPEYGLVPVTHRPDPEFAQKMIKLREENSQAPQNTAFYDQDLDYKIFPATEEQEPVPAVQVNANMTHETAPEAPEHKSWLSRSGEWFKRRQRALGFGAVALSAVLLFSDTAPVNAPHKTSDTPIEAAEPKSLPGIVTPQLVEGPDQTINNVGDETAASAEVPEEEILRLTIPDGGNLSWTVEYELAMRGVPDDQLSDKVAVVVSYLQAQKPDRDLGLVYADEVFEVALDQELRHLLSAA